MWARQCRCFSKAHVHFSSAQLSNKAHSYAPSKGVESNAASKRRAFLALLQDPRCSKSQAERAFDDLRRHKLSLNPKHGTAAIAALGKRHLWQEAIALLDDPTLKLDSITRGAAISALERSSQWDTALALLLSSSNVREKDISMVISACGKAEKWELALAMFGLLLHHFTPGVLCYNTVISACERGWRWAWAVHFFSEMPQRALKPTVVTFSAVVSAFEKIGAWERAVAMLRCARQARLAVDVTLCSAIISACAQGHQWQMSLMLLRQMNLTGPVPNAVTYNAALSACEKASQWRLALVGLHSFGGAKLEPTTVTFNTAISACGKGGEWSIALSLFESMSSRGITRNMVTYNAIISACEKSTQWQLATRLFDAMSQRSFSPDVLTYNAVMKACERGRNWAGALDYFRQIVPSHVEPGTISHNIATISHNIVLLSLSGTNRHVEALEWLREAQYLGARTVPLQPSVLPDAVKLDLHGPGGADPAGVEVARLSVQNVLIDILSGVLPSSENLDLIVVTGVGSHGPDGISVLKPVVLSLLRDELDLEAHELPHNPGRIRVPARSLQKMTQ